MLTTAQMIELIGDAGHEYRTYSGRGMGGRSCVAIDCDDPMSTIADLIDACNNIDFAQELAETLRRAMTDTMGRGQVLYFPALRIEEREPLTDITGCDV